MNHPGTTRLSSWPRLIFGLALLIGLCAVTGGLARPAHAQTTLTVSDCSSDAQLQADVAQANRDNAGDVITFACSGDLKLTSTLTITGSMTLSGSGQSVTLDGGGSLQVLYVPGQQNNSVSLTLKTLTIAHGYTSNFSASQSGGLDNEGGTVTISNSTFANNSSDTLDGGGGLINNGTMTISNSTFANNSATGGVGVGGGLFNAFGTVSISNSTFANNSSHNAGGGLYNDIGTVSISNSTFANNSAPQGGGLFNGEGTVSISNSTFANNSAPDYGGGGLFNAFGTVSISNSTFANNSASQGGGGGLANSSTINISGSIVAANTGGDCVNAASIGASITDNGYNLSSDSSCGFTGTGSVQNTNPKLGPLASNGGPTQTLALLKGSPAIDYIPLASALCPRTDQRGHKRPDNLKESACDIGAYES